jgi:hypothetical protein
MRSFLYSLAVLVLLAACGKKADNEPTPKPNEEEELILVLDGYTGLYNVTITEETRDMTGAVTTSTTDTIIVLSRVAETTMEFLQYNVDFVRSDNYGTLYEPRAEFVLNNSDNTADNYERLYLLRDGSRRIRFVEHAVLSSGVTVTRTYEGTLQ